MPKAEVGDRNDLGHLKSDKLMDRNHLKGMDEDRINAFLAGCGFNLLKLLMSFLAFIFGWLFIHHFEGGDPSPGCLLGFAAA